MPESATDFGVTRFPDFVGIGAQKAGTTWLYRMLEQHPDAWLPPVKELHYFNALHLDYRKDPATGLTTLDRMRMEKALEAIASLNGGKQSDVEKIRAIYAHALIGLRRGTDAWYGSIFGLAPAGRVAGEITPEYALLPDAGIAHMTRLNPAIRIVFLLRDPIDRAWSDLRMPRNKLQDFPPVVEYIRRPRFVERADYAATIERYRVRIDGHNILLGYFEEVAGQPLALLQRVCGFLGLAFDPSMFANVDTPVHQGQPRDIPSDVYAMMREALEPVYRRLLTLDHPIVRAWHRKHYG